jgi:diguanylate cyclase (GGDEF)-like protein
MFSREFPVTDLARDSNRRVVSIMLRAGAIAAVLGALGIYAWGIFISNRALWAQTSDIRAVASSLLQTDGTAESRQRMLQLYLSERVAGGLESVNAVLVVDGSGRIVLSSRQAWRSISVADRILARSELEDSQFVQIAECFRGAGSSMLPCFDDYRGLYLPWSSSFTQARPIQMFRRSGGLSREDFLLIVNFDSSGISPSSLLDLLSSLLASSLITLGLFIPLTLALYRGLLPGLQQFAETDGLTLLMNRTAFMDVAVQLLAQAESEAMPYVMVIIDIDHFKTVNDTFGHMAGDHVLTEVSGQLRQCLRSEDLVGRLGGEELALLLECSSTQAEQLLERIRSQVENCRPSHQGKEISVSISIGAASTEYLGYNVDYLYSAADRALYRAKRDGRNRVRWSLNRDEDVSPIRWSPGDLWRQSFQSSATEGATDPGGS